MDHPTATTAANLPPTLPASRPPAASGQSPRTIRVLGWLLMVVGPGLSAAMVAAAYFLYGAIAEHAYHGGAQRWHGSPEFTRLTFELLGSIFVFGIMTAVAGAYQARHGRRSPALIIAMLVPVLAIVYFGYTIISTHSPSGGLGR